MALLKRFLSWIRPAERWFLRSLKGLVPRQLFSFEDVSYELSLARSEPSNPIVGVIISAYLPNEDAKDLLKVAVQSLLAQVGVPISVWVVAAGHPEGVLRVNPEEFSDTNFISTETYPVGRELKSIRDFFGALLGLPKPRNGSTVNGWSLDLGLNVLLANIREPKYVMTLQMDVMFTRQDSLSQMLEKFDSGTACVGVLGQLNYGKTMWGPIAQGCIWETRLIKNLGLNFGPDFPGYDVGEKAVFEAVSAGYKAIALKNIRSHPELKLDQQEFGRFQDVTVNDAGDVIFLHLGRGIHKSVGTYVRNAPITIAEWCHYFDEIKADMKSE